MANTKDSQIRQRVIDRCLRSEKPYRLVEIMDECNEELQKRGEQTVEAENTIRADIKNLEEIYGAEIITRKEGRFNYWSYADKNFSIFNNPLKDDEIAKLKETIQMISRFSGRPDCHWIDDIATRLNSFADYEPDQRKIVGYDDNPDYGGQKWFNPIFNAISSKHTLRIEYKDFNDNAIKVVVYPYYLKQYNKRWFLFCTGEGHTNLSNYPLDRIKSIEVTNIRYLDTDLDFDEYFYDVIGPTIPKHSEIQTVKLWVSKRLLSYIKTKPLHGSQKINEETAEGAIVKIKVHVNEELKQLIMSYSDRVKVLEPNDLQEEIIARLQSALENNQ